MSDSTLALVLTVAIMGGLLLWVPLLRTGEALINRSSSQRPDNRPNLVEEDTGPQFTGEVA
jgi:hypothetical protein